MHLFVSIIFYNIFCATYAFAIRLAATFNRKARLWAVGRRNFRTKLAQAIGVDERYIWIHCSSLGEFEQGRPVIEALKQKYTDHKILLTFFSPSGYEVRKNYDLANHVCYLPMDSPDNATAFLDIVRPSLVVFVKYEFWYHYLNQLHNRQIPTIIISAAFRKEQPFFRKNGSLFRNMLGCFDVIFVQDEQSRQLLLEAGLGKEVLLSGDTRYDRVAAIAAGIKPVAEIEQFVGNSKILIAGSTWPEDEKMLGHLFPILPDDWKLVIAPHEIDKEHINIIVSLFTAQTALYSELTTNRSNPNRRVLIIDNIGMLSRLYACGSIAWIGGGYRKGGIHNILEPAIFGLPVLFGPVYEKFVEAREMVSANLAFPVITEKEAGRELKKLIEDTPYREQLKLAIKNFIHTHTGATKIIMDKIEEKGWLGCK